MLALEDRIRAYCADALDPLVGADRFDFVADLGAQMPMRVIGMLLGIPESDQEAGARPAARQPAHRGRASPWHGDRLIPRRRRRFGDYLDWRAEHPSDDLMTELLQRRVRGRDGYDAAPERRTSC